VLIFVVFVDWRVAYSASKDLIETRLKGSAEVAAASLPYFFETGQSLLSSIGEDVLINNPEDLNHELGNSVRSINYFSEIYIFDRQGTPLGGYPDPFPQSKSLSVEEQTGINLAITGVSSQIYSSMSSHNEKTVLMTFISSVYDSQSDLQGVLVGRTVFETNPYVQPVLSSMNLSGDGGGEIFILDDQNRIIFHSNETQELWTKYAQNLSNSGLFENLSANGESYYYYSQPLTNRSWSVVVGLPKNAVQDLALKIAAPLLWVLLFVIVLVVLAIRFSIHPITKTLQSLTKQAKLISQGELENSMSVESVDELGQLAFSFEQMRLRLKDRLDELKQLLFASQGVSKHLDIRTSIQPILQTSMGENVDCARVVLIRQVTADLLLSSYLPVGIGKENESIKSLDQQLFEMMQFQDILPIQNLSRFKRFVVPGQEKPGAILAIALHQENQYFGVFWVGYSTTKLFKEEEIQFFKTIASQAAMAASNAQLYSTAELGRQRFEAVLNSTPDPVMVFDEENRLILINPAAKQLGGIFKETEIGLKIKDVIEHQELLDLLNKDTTNRDTSREIYLSNRRVFFTTVSSVIRNDQSVGKVCLLRDITQYKEVDTFKSDIVSMVSHDLRSPLTLMRGYASMLQMVGEINEQQRSYIAKIVSGVDSMSKLVNNLLDLGRIEAGIGLKIDQLNPISIAEQVVYELQPHATQKNIELLLENDLNRDMLIEADSALLQQAIYNIVENALKYNSIGGKVKVNISSKNGFATYEISDNGIGIAPIDLPHLFEKFYRSGRREAYNQRGSGLGLAIVKSIIEKHNGKVWVESKLGRGSSFYIQLPTKQT
jgi:PAS domain S-box-containing protein